ncbi:hypothetical protein K0M31_006509 [Melipona bicolor]|uniref:Uncharacterized protein n=1 Tax=Melipona bicolor TaxID=60889 RepID=A0AA40KLU5_9HYME|nr:hypothetical protein K0M31_006509 [Melipona bicolor]
MIFPIESQTAATVLKTEKTQKIKKKLKRFGVPSQSRSRQSSKSSSKTLEIADQNDYRALKMERGYVKRTMRFRIELQWLLSRWWEVDSRLAKWLMG